MGHKGKTDWGPIEDGFAAGPSEVLEGSGVEVLVQAVWTEDEGVSVAVEVTDDEPMPAALALAVAESVMRLALMRGPVKIGPSGAGRPMELASA